MKTCRRMQTHAVPGHRQKLFARIREEAADTENFSDPLLAYPNVDAGRVFAVAVSPTAVMTKRHFRSAKGSDGIVKRRVCALRSLVSANQKFLTRAPDKPSDALNKADRFTANFEVNFLQVVIDANAPNDLALISVPAHRAPPCEVLSRAERSRKSWRSDSKYRTELPIFRNFGPRPV